MLITSSQASVAISAIIVVACTTALFLSGYAIQQRTLRDLRAAIKPPPRPSPQVFIQDSSQWQLDGTDGTDNSQGAALSVEVKQTQSNPAAHQDPDLHSQGSGSTGGVDPETDAAIKGTDGSGNPDQEAQKPLSRVERRKRIKEEIRMLSQGETPVYYQRRLW